MWRVALTGGIATGKSYVLARLSTHGVATIDADRVARDVVAWGEPAAEEISERFGGSLYGVDRVLDRAGLAKIVFDDSVARRDLEQIVHPRVRATIDAWFQHLCSQGVPTGVAAIPLLFETGRQADFDQVVTTACHPSVQLRRLVERDGLSEAAASKRLAAQMSTDEKSRLADCVIHTDGDFADTNEQVDRFCRSLPPHVGPR